MLKQQHNYFSQQTGELTTQNFLSGILVHPLPQIRRELLDYLRRLKVMENPHSFSLTMNYSGDIKVGAVSASKIQQLLEHLLEDLDTQPNPNQYKALYLLQEGKYTLLEGAIKLGVSISKAKAIRKGVEPRRKQISPLIIFQALQEGRRTKEIGFTYGITSQTVTNIRTRVLDALLYKFVQEFLTESKAA